MEKLVFLLLGVSACALAQYQQQQQQHTTPVPILKQINRHNEDGSYSYGYEGADGSFKIETKFPNGEVLGKYGYVDDTGKVREVEYGASRRGFEVSGQGINVPPPTLINNEVTNGEEDDGQYREDPSIYYKETATASKLQLPAAQRYSPPAPQYNPQPYSAPRAPSHVQQYFSQSAPAYNPPQPAYNPPAYNPAAYNPGPSRYYAPAPIHVDPNQFHGHPARNIDIATGSYSITYSG